MVCIAFDSENCRTERLVLIVWQNRVLVLWLDSLVQGEEDTRMLQIAHTRMLLFFLSTTHSFINSLTGENKPWIIHEAQFVFRPLIAG